MTGETGTEEAPIIREAAAELNLAVRVEYYGPGHPKLFVVDDHRREMQISPQLVRGMPKENLHALLAAFVVGATEIRVGEKTIVLVTSAGESA